MSLDRNALAHPSPHRRRRRGLPALVAGAVAVATVGVVLSAEPASAAPPTFPDNLVVFPDRDFVSVEGYSARAGQKALLTVDRAGEGRIGATTATVSGTDVAFEVNHPGGACWGAGVGPAVTPDIRPGDVVTLHFDGQAVADTVVQDGYVTDGSELAADGRTLTVTGHLSGSVNPAFTEQRIVEPALKDTAVGRRDIRALPGGPVADDSGAYTSALTFSGDTFTATYVFADPQVAAIADAASFERLLSWQATDNDANRQGLTIAEFGESGGPGFGGCPNGPLEAGPSAPTDVRAVTVAGGVRVTWTPATRIAGTPPIDGYEVTAAGRTVVDGQSVTSGMRIRGQAASGTTLTGLSPDETYDIEVVSISSAGRTVPPVVVQVETDTTDPVITASPGPGEYRTAQQVTLASNEPGTDIYYTVDGSDPTSGADPAPEALPYAGPIEITADTPVLRYVAFDPAGNAARGEFAYRITDTPLPAAPRITGSSVGTGSVTLTWQPGDAADDTFAVRVFDDPAGPVLREEATDGSPTIVTGLTEGTPYWFAVVAGNANGETSSAQVGPLTPQGAVVAAAGADQTVVRQTTPTEVTLDGSGSTASGATYLWEQVLADPGDPDAVTLTSADTLAPTFTLPVFASPMTNDPLRFRLTVTVDGVTRTDEVLVTPQPDEIAVSSVRYRARDMRIRGTGTTAGATVTVHVDGPTGPVIGTAVTVAAVAPETGADWELRLRNGQVPRPNPGSIWVESNLGGTTGPVATN